MYIRLTKEGAIKDYNKEVLSFFDLEINELDGLNYMDLLDRDISISTMKRFIRVMTSNLNKALTISIKVNSILTWTEWSFHLGISDELMLIGKDITCVKKFEPIIRIQNNKLRVQNKNMIDSIVYAKQIQSALLPSLNLISCFENSFVFYKPKDVVSGDFYWFYRSGSQIFIISIDCTGHGVPGALMTVLVNTLLNEIIKLDEVQFPHQILQLLDSKLIETLHTNGKIINDGLDIAVGLFDFNSMVLSFSGALQNIQIIRNSVLTKLAGERYPVGYYPYCVKEFKTINYQLEKGDRFYLFSDGILDQFGGEFDKKIGTKRFTSHLIKTGELTMNEQKKSILNFYNKWKGSNDQIDDVLVMGFEV
jgi:serine phosphatase RsbU (regulator of sigma subunit)